MRLRGARGLLVAISLLHFFSGSVRAQENHVDPVSSGKGVEQSGRTLVLELIFGTEIVSDIFAEVDSYLTSEVFKELIQKPVVGDAIRKWLKQESTLDDLQEIWVPLERKIEEALKANKVSKLFQANAERIAEELRSRALPTHARSTVFYPQEEVQRRVQESIYKIIPHFAEEIATKKFGTGTRAIIAKKFLARAGSLSGESTSPISQQIKEDVRKLSAGIEKKLLEVLSRELRSPRMDPGAWSAKLALVPIPGNGTALLPKRAETIFSATEVTSDGTRKEWLHEVLPAMESE